MMRVDLFYYNDIQKCPERGVPTAYPHLRLMAEDGAAVHNASVLKVQHELWSSNVPHNSPVVVCSEKLYEVAFSHHVSARAYSGSRINPRNMQRYVCQKRKQKGHTLHYLHRIYHYC